MIELCSLRRRCLRDALGAGKEAVEVVEAAILRVDDHDVLEPVDPTRRCGRACGDQRNDGDYEQAEWSMHGRIAVTPPSGLVPETSPVIVFPLTAVFGVR